MYWHILWMLIGYAIRSIAVWLVGIDIVRKIGNNDFDRVIHAVTNEHFVWIQELEKYVWKFNWIIGLMVSLYAWPYDVLLLVYRFKKEANKIIAEREGS